MHNVAQAYLQTQVTTTNQADILILLYDGAVNFLNSAKERIAAKDPAGKGILISKALDVINELDSTLNMEKGGDLAKNLHSLYDFCSRRLLMANLKQSAEIIDEVLMVLGGLRGAYVQIMNNPEAKLAAEEAGRRAAAQSTRTQTAPAPPARQAAPAAPGMGRHALSSYGRQSIAPCAVEPVSADTPTEGDLSASVSSAPVGTVAASTDTSPAPATVSAGIAPAPEAAPPSLGGRGAAGLSLYKKFAGPQA